MMHYAVLSNTFRHPSAQSKCWFIQEFSPENERIGGYHWQDFDLSDNRYEWKGEKHLLGTLDDVCATLSLHQHTGRYLYPTLVLGHLNDMWCIDVDNKESPDGDLSDTAKLMLDGFFDWDTCVELSKSGSGVHVFGHGATIPEGLGNRGAGIEVYTHQRAVTMTLNWLTTDTPSDSQNAMFDAACHEYLKPKPVAAKTAADGDVTEFSKAFPDDKAALQQIIMAEQRHPAPGAPFVAWVHCDGATLAQHAPRPESERARGKTAWDGTHIDMLMVGTLVYHLGNDPERIIRIMREQMPAMYRARADKWRRDDYMESTVAKAAAMKAGKRSSYGEVENKFVENKHGFLVEAPQGAPVDWPTILELDNLFTAAGIGGSTAEFNPERAEVFRDTFGFNSRVMTEPDKEKFVHIYERFFPSSKNGFLPKARILSLIKGNLPPLNIPFPSDVYYRLDTDMFFDYATGMSYSRAAFDMKYKKIGPSYEGWSAYGYFMQPDSPDIPLVNGAIYHPGKPAVFDNMVNLFNPARLPAIPHGKPPAWVNEFGAMIRKLAKITAGVGNDTDADILLSWFAKRVNDTAWEPTWGPVMCGAEGSGKSTWSLLMDLALGDENTIVINNHSLTEKFNDYSGKLFIFAEEVDAGQGRREQSAIIAALKEAIGNTKRSTRGMRKDVRKTYSNAGWALSTNIDGALPLKEGARRFFVVHNGFKTGDALEAAWGISGTWYARLRELMAMPDAGGWLRHLFSTMETVDVTQWHRAPWTAAKADMIGAAATDLEDDLYDLLGCDGVSEAGFISGVGVTGAWLYEQLQRRGHKTATTARIGRTLLTMGYEKISSNVRLGVTRTSLYKHPSQDADDVKLKFKACKEPG